MVGIASSYIICGILMSVASILKKRPKTFLDVLINPGAPVAGSSCRFRLSSLILRDTEVIARNAFFINSGHRFLTDITIQNTNNMKDRLKIKNNQRHKFSNFEEPCTLNSYYEKPRCHTNTRFLLKNAGNDF